MRSIQLWRRASLWFLAASPLLALPATAQAYIDPNTGGLLFQILAPILAIITSAWLFLRDYIRNAWHRATARFRKPRADSSEPAGDAPAADRGNSGKSTL